MIICYFCIHVLSLRNETSDLSKSIKLLTYRLVETWLGKQKTNPGKNDKIFKNALKLSKISLLSSQILEAIAFKTNFCR